MTHTLETFAKSFQPVNSPIITRSIIDAVTILNDVTQDLGYDLHARDMNHIHAAWRMGDLLADARHLAEIRA